MTSSTDIGSRAAVSSSSGVIIADRSYCSRARARPSRRDQLAGEFVERDVVGVVRRDPVAERVAHVPVLAAGLKLDFSRMSQP